MEVCQALKMGMNGVAWVTVWKRFPSHWWRGDRNYTGASNQHATLNVRQSKLLSYFISKYSKQIQNQFVTHWLVQAKKTELEAPLKTKICTLILGNIMN